MNHNVSIAQFKCALSCLPAAKGKSRGTPIRSLWYSNDKQVSNKKNFKCIKK